jgi:hypothetical protein
MPAPRRCCLFSFCCFWLCRGIGVSYLAPAFSLALVREHLPSLSSPRAVRARGASALAPMARPITGRVAVINVFDKSYLIRDGTGVGRVVRPYIPN